MGSSRLWKALNPLAVEGQIIGSCHMGMGQVLSEEMRYGRSGNLMNPDLLDYKIPSVHEMPEVDSHNSGVERSRGSIRSQRGRRGPSSPDSSFSLQRCL